jgi:hypothetical protein
MDALNATLAFVGRYGATIGQLGLLALTIVTVATVVVTKRFPDLRSQVGAVLGVENNMAAIALSAIALGAFLFGVDGMGASVMEWACKAQEQYIASGADHYWADHYAYPGNGTAVAVTPANFKDPTTNEQKYLSFTPRCFTALSGTYTFTGTANTGQRDVTVSEAGTHDPATLNGLLNFTGAQTKNLYDRLQGGLTAV